MNRSCPGSRGQHLGSVTPAPSVLAGAVLWQHPRVQAVVNRSAVCDLCSSLNSRLFPSPFSRIYSYEEAQAACTEAMSAAGREGSPLRQCLKPASIFLPASIGVSCMQRGSRGSVPSKLGRQEACLGHIARSGLRA